MKRPQQLIVCLSIILVCLFGQNAMAQTGITVNGTTKCISSNSNAINFASDSLLNIGIIKASNANYSIFGTGHTGLAMYGTNGYLQAFNFPNDSTKILRGNGTFASTSTFQPWTISGGTVYFNGGKVLIGGTSALSTASLDIMGASGTNQLSIDNSTTGHGLFTFTGSGSGTMLAYNGTTTTIALQAGGTSYFTNELVAGNAGSLSTASLDVVGSTGSQMLVIDNNTTGHSMFISTSTGDAGILNGYSAMANTLSLNCNGASFFNGGKVGIGTTSPAAHFDLNDATGTAYSNIIGIEDYAGNNVMSAYAASGQDFITFGSTTAYGVKPVTINGGFLSVNGGGGVAAYLGISSANVATDYTNRFDIYNPYDGTHSFIVNYQGNVGIGTASPTFPLDVSGTMHASSIVQVPHLNLYANGTSTGISIDGPNFSIGSSSGAIGFGNNNLNTSGTVSAHNLLVSTGTVTLSGIVTDTVNDLMQIDRAGHVSPMNSATLQAMIHPNIIPVVAPCLQLPYWYSNLIGSSNNTTGIMTLYTIPCDIVGIGVSNPDASFSISNSAMTNAFSVVNPTSHTDVFTIDQKGRTVINPTSDPTYTINPTSGIALAVDGEILATDVMVKLHVDWPDYVFKKDYKLPSLDELETYIKQNHHLPNIPSADSLKSKEGISVSNMMTAQTKKLEELTLYLIQLNKEVKALEEENKKLKEQIEVKN